MAEVFFYQLTHSTVEATLPTLIEKTLARAWRAVIRFGLPERLEAIDALLWTYADSSFVPHGTAGPHADRQPVYLTCGPELPNTPNLLFLVDGAQAVLDEIKRLDRTVIIFDGRDETALSDARRNWQSITAADVTAVYWAQEDGRWIERRRVDGT